MKQPGKPVPKNDQQKQREKNEETYLPNDEELDASLAAFAERQKGLRVQAEATARRCVAIERELRGVRLTAPHSARRVQLEPDHVRTCRRCARKWEVRWPGSEGDSG